MSSVMLNAYIGMTPVRSACRSQHRHDGADAFGQRRGRAVALQLVVLDEVDTGRREFAHQLGEVGRRQPDARLHDRADHRAVRSAHEPPGARDAERRAGVPLRERGRQIEVDELDRGELLDLEQVAGHGREQVRQRRAEVVERKAQPQPGAPAGSRVADCARQRRCTGQRHLVDALDLCGEPRTQLVGLARDPHERAGGLLAREHLRRVLQRQRSLDHVGRDHVSSSDEGRVGHQTTGIHTDISEGPRLPHAK